METALPLRTHARDTRVLSGISGVVTTLVVGAILTLSSIVAPSEEAFAATGTTVTAAEQDVDAKKAPFPDLELTVSQTTDLASQAIEISWTGGKKSALPNAQVGGENFLQFAQCWGNDPEDPEQPDRTTCQYGAFGTPGATRDNFRALDTVDKADEKYSTPDGDYFNPPNTSIPFRSVTGEVVAAVVDKKPVDPAVDVNNNRFFTKYTSNEIPWAGSGSDGTGSTKFEVQTAVQSSGLGCGAPMTAANGDVTGSACWLVMIPRGTADNGTSNITQSGLFADSWKHKLAVRLEFRPLGVRCAMGASERQISGSELVAGAVASWQPRICNSAGGAVYTIATGTESDALKDAAGTEPAPLALTSLPLSAAIDPLTYAPIALSGLSISFAIDREPQTRDGVPDDVQGRARLPFGSLNLTPRLVAKLLTNSYVDSLPSEADRTHVGYVSSADPGSNARNLTMDPDFLAVNDAEWGYQSLVSPSLGDLLVPQGRSDEAMVLWNYVASDPDASAFLAGEADPWGMKVNPWSSTNADFNPTGIGATFPLDNFPKADPIERPAEGVIAPVNLVTWRPYTNDFDSSAYLTLRGDGQVLGAWDKDVKPQKFAKTPRSLSGLQRVLGLTDTASAAKYRVVSASLLNPAGQYVAPTTDSLTAASAAMTASAGQSQVYGFDQRSETAKGATAAYPLAMPVYAAVNPVMDDVTIREDYATFIRYAASAGQEPGNDIGQLPVGYAPLPEGWRDQALAAADTIQTGNVPPAKAAATATPPATAAQAPAPASTRGSASATTVAPAADPVAGGSVAAALAGPATPKDPASTAVQSAVPMSLLAGVASALLVPLLSRIRRKRL
jgi:hypothetical protein